MVCCLVVLLLIFFALYLWWKWRIPKCGGYLDPNLRWCDEKGRLVSGTPIPSTTCDPTTDTARQDSMARFLVYVSRLSRQASNEPMLRTSLETLGKVYPGMLLFAVPDLLRLLPSNFGQNYTTPYGMISFYQSFPPCISNLSGFCEYLTRGTPGVDAVVCDAYLRSLSAGKTCPFALTDRTPTAWIDDVHFFNALGMLGAFSLAPHQAVVFYTDLPVADLGLNYWSYVLYLADNLDPNNECGPRQQINFASLSSALNMFAAVGISGKRFNPLTAASGTVEPGHVKFYTVVALDSTVADSVVHHLEASAPYPADFVHVLPVPAGPNATHLDPTLENPNGLTTQDPAYDPATQRLACFLRLSPSPHATDAQTTRLQDYIFARGSYTHMSEVVLVDTSTQHDLQHTEAPLSLFGLSPLSPMIPPPVNELVLSKKGFRDVSRLFVHRLRFTGYSVASLQVRNSTLNVFAPLYRNVLFTKNPYLGGFQAIQLAGNGLGDNPDAQYRLSQSACLQDSDVMVAFCVHHAALGNCLYNSVNVLDTNRAYGYGAVVLDASSPVPYYMVLVGRNLGVLNQVEARIREGLGNRVHDISIHKIPLRTGPSENGDIPRCHQVLLVERVYVNLSYASSKDTTTTFHLTDLFGPSLDTLLVDSVPDEAWESLQNTTGPTNDTLVAPLFWKISYSSVALQRLLLATVLVLVLLLLVVVFVVAWR